MAARMINIGFLGAGHFATTMAEVVHRTDGVQLYAVASTDSARAESLKPQYVFDSYEQLISCEAVDLVYVLLSNHLHFPWVIAALAQGKHVLCEKPLGLSAEEAALMFDAADAAGKLLFEAYWHLWHPSFNLAKNLVGSGAIGEIVGINSGFTHQMNFDSNFRSKAEYGGGMLLDLGCYPISAATWMLDLQVVTNPLILELELNENNVDMHIKCAAQCGTASLTITASANRAHQRWFDVYGTSGHISLENSAFSAAPEPAEGTRLVCVTDGEVEEWNLPRADPRSHMLQEIAEAIESQRQSEVPVWSFEPSSKLSILTAHAISVIQKSAESKEL